MDNKLNKVKPSPIISEPMEVAEKDYQAAVEHNKNVTHQNEAAKKHKYNPDPNAKEIIVKADGTVIYSF